VSPIRRRPVPVARSSPASSTVAVPRLQAALRRDPGDGLRTSDGYPVGIIANDGILFSQSRLKGAHFIELACQRRIPLVFLQNITGLHGRARVRGGRDREGRREARDGRASAEVPKFTVLIGGSFGGGNYAMAGRPTSRDSCGRGRTPHLGDGRPAGGPRPVDGPWRFSDDAERDAFEAPILETYEREGSPYFATARLWDDGVIDPLDTPGMLRSVSRRRSTPDPETRFGVFRM
jgi:acetyl-CoA carboxylase carboxyltransferase component